jgi:hypothetical protein
METLEEKIAAEVALLAQVPPGPKFSPTPSLLPKSSGEKGKMGKILNGFPKILARSYFPGNKGSILSLISWVNQFKTTRTVQH